MCERLCPQNAPLPGTSTIIQVWYLYLCNIPMYKCNISTNIHYRWAWKPNESAELMFHALADPFGLPPFRQISLCPGLWWPITTVYLSNTGLVLNDPQQRSASGPDFNSLAACFTDLTGCRSVQLQSSMKVLQGPRTSDQTGRLAVLIKYESWFWCCAAYFSLQCFQKVHLSVCQGQQQKGKPLMYQSTKRT